MMVGQRFQSRRIRQRKRDSITQEEKAEERKCEGGIRKAEIVKKKRAGDEN